MARRLPEEDAEVHRARELARLEQWTAEQKASRSPTRWTVHGMLPGDGDGLGRAGRSCRTGGTRSRPRRTVPVVPAAVPASPCPECREARAADARPAAAWAWWPSLSAEARRLHIAATYGTDPWSGRRCAIRIEWTDVAAPRADPHHATCRTPEPPRPGSIGERSARASMTSMPCGVMRRAASSRTWALHEE